MRVDRERDFKKKDKTINKHIDRLGLFLDFPMNKQKKKRNE